MKKVIVGSIVLGSIAITGFVLAKVLVRSSSKATICSSNPNVEASVEKEEIDTVQENTSAKETLKKEQKVFPDSVFIQEKKYFEVYALFGHVGKGKYVIRPVYVKAENGRKAAEMARVFPRVKHDVPEAIQSVKEISYEEYYEGIKQKNQDPFFTCKNVQEQRMFCPDIYDEVCVMEEKPSYKKGNHSLRHIYNEDPMFWEYIKGDISDMNIA